MAKLKRRNGERTNGHIPGTTLVGDGYFIVAFEAIPHPLPPEEDGDHHFFRPGGDFARVYKADKSNFFGHWVQGMTVVSQNNGPKTFPRSKTRPLKHHEIPRLTEIVEILNPPTRLELIFQSIEGVNGEADKR